MFIKIYELNYPDLGIKMYPLELMRPDTDLLPR